MAALIHPHPKEVLVPALEGNLGSASSTLGPGRAARSAACMGHSWWRRRSRRTLQEGRRRPARPAAQGSVHLEPITGIVADLAPLADEAGADPDGVESVEATPDDAAPFDPWGLSPAGPAHPPASLRSRVNLDLWYIYSKVGHEWDVVLRFQRSRDERISLALHFGGFDVDQVIREIGRAYRTGDLEPGIDSLVVLDPSVAPGDVGLSDIAAINACVAAHETGGDAGGYRSVFVASDRASRIFAHVYTASWAIVPTLFPRHTVMDDLASAEALFGGADLADQVHDMRPVAGVSYLR